MNSLSEHTTEDFVDIPTGVPAAALSCHGNHEGVLLIFTAAAEMEISFPRRLPQSIHKQNPFTSSLVLRDASTYKGI